VPVVRSVAASARLFQAASIIRESRAIAHAGETIAVQARSEMCPEVGQSAPSHPPEPLHQTVEILPTLTGGP
jgi:hypothetical protein